MIRIAIAAFVLVTLGLAQAGAALVAYYPVPRGAHPHDVAPAPDGKVWYTAQHQGALGLLDPKTGKTVQIPLGPNSAPHGVIVGPDRAAWVTDGGQNAIVRVDPKTHAVQPLPAAGRISATPTSTPRPSTARASSGSPARTASMAASIRRPARSTPGRRPRASAPTASPPRPTARSGTPRSPATISPRSITVSGEAMMVAPPKPGVGPRRIWSDSKGTLWVSFWNTGEVARFEPGPRRWSVWRLPKSDSGCYAVFVDDKDKVWVSDWDANAIRRFDPVTERFDTFVSNKGSADVRQILGRPGELWGAESGTDRLVVIRD